MTYENPERFVVRIRVNGTPVPQGSKKGFVVGKRAILVEANKNLPAWREAIKEAATKAMIQAPAWVVESGPVKISARLAFPRPKSHFGTGKNTDVLKPNAPIWKESTPDTDKLARAIGDSLTGIVYRDDAQVAWWDIKRTYTSSEPYAIIYVYAL